MKRTIIIITIIIFWRFFHPKDSASAKKPNWISRLENFDF